MARVEKRLYTALDGHPPPSLTKLAKEIGCAKGTLRKKFPALASQIAEKADAYYRPAISAERVLEALRAALKENPPPPLEEVSRRLGAGASTPILHKKFPDVSRQLVERYSAYGKRRLDNSALEKQLRAALERTPPPSMLAVSQEIGVSGATLHRKFPELTKAISNRFAAARRERDARNRKEARTEIRSICEQLLQEGLYPYSAIVRSQLSVPCQSQAFSDIWREVRADLGFSDNRVSHSIGDDAKVYACGHTSTSTAPLKRTG
jgi:AraC-like DNA-binding protein